MARKSRKSVSTISRPQAYDSETKKTYWETAAYARLSSENGGNDTDETLQTQIAFLKEYIREHKELKLADVYVDNGYTGTNFNRPDFERMMTDVREKKICCIVVKDLSRFGRDYLETGYYIETIFPFLGVRLIAINDNFDSSRKEDLESLSVPIKNMVNSMYAKDISKKVYTTLHEKMKRGVPITGYAPYGYTYNREEEKYEVDPETAWYVKLIFHWAIEGVNSSEIARRLNLACVPTRMQRSAEPGQKGTKSTWNLEAVRDILTYQVYTGDLVLGRTEKALFAGRTKQCEVEPEDWTIIEGTHEAIISREDFEKVRQQLDSDAKSFRDKLEDNETWRNEQPDDLRGLVFCAECGSRMDFERKGAGTKKTLNYYVCKGKHKGKKCMGNKISEFLLKTRVMDDVSRYIDLVCDKNKILKGLYNLQNEKNPFYIVERNVSETALAVEKIQSKKERLYEDYANGILTMEDYIYMKNNYKEQQEEAENKYAEAVKERKILNQRAEEFQKSAATIAGCRKDHAFCRENIAKLVDRIVVGTDGTLNIQFKFEDIIAALTNDLAAKEKTADVFRVGSGSAGQNGEEISDNVVSSKRKDSCKNAVEV